MADDKIVKPGECQICGGNGSKIKDLEREVERLKMGSRSKDMELRQLKYVTQEYELIKRFL